MTKPYVFDDCSAACFISSGNSSHHHLLQKRTARRDPVAKMPCPYPGSIEDVSGVTLAHETLKGGSSGFTLALCPGGARANYAALGGAPGTSDLAVMEAENSATEVHGVALCGGSVFGLAAVDGARRYLSEQRVGLAMDGASIPLIPSAVVCEEVQVDISLTPR